MLEYRSGAISRLSEACYGAYSLFHDNVTCSFGMHRHGSWTGMGLPFMNRNVLLASR